MTAPRARVGFLRHTFLPSSETFIYTSMKVLDRYDVSAFAVRRRSHDKFPVDDVVSLDVGRLAFLESWLYSATTLSPKFLRWVESVDLVHAHMGMTGAHALAATRRKQRPLVISYYGKDVTLLRSRARFTPEHWHYLVRHRALWRRADRVTALSRHMQADLVAQGVPADKIRIVPLGIDLARFRCEREPRPTPNPVVLMVGREVDKKGFDDGLRACALARDAGLDVRVRILGFGKPGRVALEALAAELGLDVTWLDPKTPTPAAMADADILLVPSRTAKDGDQEGTPTVICEGGASGLPVVSTLHAGIPEQVAHGETGLLAPERAPAELAAHLVSLRDPALRHALGQAGRAKMEREYSLAALRDNLQAMYDELVAARRPGGARLPIGIEAKR